MSLDLWLGQVPEGIEDPIMYEALLNIHNALQLLAEGENMATDLHTRVHQGNLFAVDTVYGSTIMSSLADNTALSLVVAPAAGNYAHLDFSLKIGGAGVYGVTELASDASAYGGTVLVPNNKKLGSSNTFNGVVRRDATVVYTDSLYKESDVILGTGSGQNRMGSELNFDHELIITPGKPLLIRLFNRSGGAVPASITAIMYNASQIPDS